MIVAFSPAAERDIEDIGDYIYAENPLAAVRLISCLRKRCDKITDAPRTGSPRTELWPGLRSTVFFPYVIFYTVSDEGKVVRIQRIIHGARDIDLAFNSPIDD